MTTERVLDFMSRHFGSHERPAVLFAMWCGDYIVSEDGSELDVQLDDDGVSLSALVAETWIWRNEKMGNIAPDEWVLLFDDCVWLLGDDGLHATIPSWPLTLYRCGHPEGMSWAMNIESALHFQKMRPHEPVWKCSVADCSDLLAIFHSRNESEAVLRPDGAWRASVEQIVSLVCHAEALDA